MTFVTVLLPRLLSPEEKLPAFYNLNTWHMESMWKFQPGTASPPPVCRDQVSCRCHIFTQICEQENRNSYFPFVSRMRPQGVHLELKMKEKKQNDLRDGFARSGVARRSKWSSCHLPLSPSRHQSHFDLGFHVSHSRLPLEPNTSRYFN